MIDLMRNKFDYDCFPVNIDFIIERYINILKGESWASMEMIDKMNIDNYEEFLVIFDLCIGSQDMIKASFSGMRKKSKGVLDENTYFSEVPILYKEYCIDMISHEEDTKTKLYNFLREMHHIYRFAGNKMYGKNMLVFYRYCDLRSKNVYAFFGIQNYKLAHTFSFGYNNDLIIPRIIDLIYKESPLVIPF